jgi:hypothetical protein
MGVITPEAGQPGSGTPGCWQGQSQTYLQAGRDLLDAIQKLVHVRGSFASTNPCKQWRLEERNTPAAAFH